MSYTTRLLELIDDTMPRRHQVIVGAIVAFVSLSSIAGTALSRTTHAPAPVPIVIIVATPRVSGAGGLAKEAALSAPTAMPQPTVATIERPAETARTTGTQSHERPSDKAGPGNDRGLR